MQAITIQWKGRMRFDGRDGAGHIVAMDSSKAGGGDEAEVRPMELLLIALGGCTSMSVRRVMERMHLDYEGFEMQVEGDRKEEPPQIFTAIRLSCTVTAPGLSMERFLKAFELGALKYCPVGHMVKPACPLSYTVILNGQRHEYPAAG